MAVQDRDFQSRRISKSAVAAHPLLPLCSAASAGSARAHTHTHEKMVSSVHIQPSTSTTHHPEHDRRQETLCLRLYLYRKPKSRFPSLSVRLLPIFYCQHSDITAVSRLAPLFSVRFNSYETEPSQNAPCPSSPGPSKKISGRGLNHFALLARLGTIRIVLLASGTTP